MEVAEAQIVNQLANGFFVDVHRPGWQGRSGEAGTLKLVHDRPLLVRTVKEFRDLAAETIYLININTDEVI